MDDGIGQIITTADLPGPVESIENVYIPMRDGCRLAARLWLPRSARGSPVPAVLEYIPYRKRDIKRQRDEAMHAYFASHGYAGVRVDLRGSGDSEGVLEDEYLEQELADGEDVIAWLASQPWCNGRVGMIGISWGGFNGLQIAARRPPALRAVIAVCATDDRYADDVHYMGGCLLNDNLSWASTMFAYNSLPPDPEVAGEHWRDLWMRRLDGSGLWIEKWMQHPHRDQYWRHGSVCEDYDAICCPVMTVSGWADGYSNVVFRLVENLNVPVKGLVGPWSHVYPHMGSPGPEIGFLQECLRWWQRWLHDSENGVEHEPRLRVWMQDSMEPQAVFGPRMGRWVTESSWPSENVGERRYQLATGRLVRPGERDARMVPQSVQSLLSVGLFAGKWCSFGSAPDLPYDQREEDGGSLVYESAPLEERVEMLGAPVLELTLEVDRPVAMVAVRLCDGALDGKSTRVTYGLLNLCHRDGHEYPSPLETGRVYRVRVALNYAAYSFPPGHRLRLSLSTSYWPLAWVPPEPVKLTVHPEGSALILPQRRSRPEDDQALVPFPPVEMAAQGGVEVLDAPVRNWRISRDLGSEESALHVLNDEGAYRLLGTGTVVRRRSEEWYRFRGEALPSVNGEVVSKWGFERPGWEVCTQTRTLLHSDRDFFYIHASLDAFEGQSRVFSRNWNRRIKRELL